MVVAIDGKSLRRAFDRAAGRAPLHVVTAFGTDARIVIGQRAVPRDDDAGGSEITAARARLATLCLDGVLVTADAACTPSPTPPRPFWRGAAIIASR